MARQPADTTNSDERLCAAFCGGDAEAGDLLIGRMLPLVRRRAYAIRGRGVDSDDLIQEGLLALVYAMRAYQPGHGAAFSTFAYRCVTNRLLTVLAAAGREAPELLLDGVECYTPVPAGSQQGDPQEILIGREELERWRNRMSNLLSGFEQKAMELYLSGHTYHEMARVLTSTTKAVDNALQRARRKLRAPAR